MQCRMMGTHLGGFEKLENMVKDMKTPLHPGCKKKWTKLFTSLKLLQLKATHHWTDHGFKALLDLLRDMLPEQTICPLEMEVEKNPCL